MSKAAPPAWLMAVTPRGVRCDLLTGAAPSPPASQLVPAGASLSHRAEGWAGVHASCDQSLYRYLANPQHPYSGHCYKKISNALHHQYFNLKEKYNKKGFGYVKSWDFWYIKTLMISFFLWNWKPKVYSDCIIAGLAWWVTKRERLDPQTSKRKSDKREDFRTELLVSRLLRLTPVVTDWLFSTSLKWNIYRVHGCKLEMRRLRWLKIDSLYD